MAGRGTHYMSERRDQGPREFQRGGGSSKKGRGRGRGADRGRGRGRGRGQSKQFRRPEQSIEQPLSPLQPYELAMTNNIAELEKIKDLPRDVIAYCQDVKTIEYLIGRGIDPTYGSSMALAVACKTGRIDAVRKLVEEGCDPTAENNRALRFTEDYGHDEVVTYLKSVI